MAAKYKIIDRDNDSGTRTFVVDVEADLTSLPTDKKFFGSSAICISTSEVYMLNSEGEWKKL